MAATTAYVSRRLHRAARAPLLALALSASACSYLPEVAMPDLGVSNMFASFSGPSTAVTSDALTVQRVRGGNPNVEPLLPESGNVWPEAEAPRPTLLGSPDEAMRNIPIYNPALIQGVPAARSPVATPGVARGPSPVGDVSPPGRRTVSPVTSIGRAGGPTGGGAVIRDGNVETWIGPDGRASTRIVTE